MSFVLVMPVPLTYAMSYFVYERLWDTILATALVAIASGMGIYTVYSSVMEGMKLERGNVTRWVGLTAIGYYFPILYQAVLDGQRGVFSVPFVASLVVPASLVGGACLYELHLPERFFPGKLDLVGNSHMWMHFGVIVAHLMGFCFVLHNYLARTGQSFVGPVGGSDT
ncbi:inc metabolism membrane protein [Pleodorina starrii]|nr:inc metabolism membrane protein [Pleodorina starrii]